MSTIGDNIRKRREELGYTQEELAKILGYKSKSTINKIESGINDVNQSKILAFANALDIPPSYLMGWDAEINIVKESPEYYGVKIDGRELDFKSILLYCEEYIIKYASNIIKYERIKSNLTEKFVSEKSGITLQDYLALEIDHENIGTDKIIKIVDAINIDFYYFMGLLSGFNYALKTIDEIECPDAEKRLIKESLIMKSIAD